MFGVIQIRNCHSIKHGVAKIFAVAVDAHHASLQCKEALKVPSMTLWPIGYEVQGDNSGMCRQSRWQNSESSYVSTRTATHILSTRGNENVSQNSVALHPSREGATKIA